MEKTNIEIQSGEKSNSKFNWQGLLAYLGYIGLNAVFWFIMMIGDPRSKTAGTFISSLYLLLILFFGYFLAFYYSRKPLILSILYYFVPPLFYMFIDPFDFLYPVYFETFFWLAPPLMGLRDLTNQLVTQWLLAPGVCFIIGYFLGIGSKRRNVH